MSKNKPMFTLLRQPDADDLADLFRKLTGRDVSEEDKQKMKRILAEKKSG